ncbi:GumC family protein [Pedobacter sp.]|uniref:GumC family protein n=1 Tax=Pedobacter sp. TaxID=1411316 RepID=UPI003D7F4358
MKMLKIVIDKWPYILGSLLLFLAGGYLFLYFTMPTYSANASIKIEDKKSELSELISIRNIYDRTSKSESEKFILYSRNVLTQAIKALDYQISFYNDDRFNLNNLYPEKPLSIQVSSIPNGKIHNTLFKYERLNDQQFRLHYAFQSFKKSSVHSYGEQISLNGFSFKITAAPRAELTYHFRFNVVNDFLMSMNESLKIDDNQNTNILHLTYTDTNPYFARDILNSILSSYLKFDRSQRSVSVKQTALYIDTLLKNMSVVLKKSAQDIQQFKTENQLLDVSSNAELLITRLSSLETEKHNLSIQKLFTTDLQRSLQKNHNVNTPNFSLQGVEDSQLLTLLQKLNLLMDKRNEFSKTYQPGSLFIVDLDEQLSAIKLAINNNIKSQNLKNQELITYLDQQIQGIKSSMQSAPAIEKDYISLQSDFNINQKVYNYLSEKKLEAHISTAAVTSGAQVIDEAMLSAQPSYPIEVNVYKDFALAGFVIGTLMVFLVRKLNPYLYEIETITELSTIPIVGTIGKHIGKLEEHKILSIDYPRSLFSESIRAMRANLDFMIAGNNGQVICITSEISGEGKSFTSLNLAGTLGLINKKVVVVATDLRRSQLHKTFGVSNFTGLSSYLSAQEAVGELCKVTRFANLDFIPAGPVPPNPSELIQSERMKDLISYLKERYDFIILDSAPVGLVSDSIPLMRLADLNLFVLRYGVSSRHAATLPEKLAKEFNLNNVAIVLNCFNKGPVHSNYYSLSTNEKSFEHYASANAN